jgi:hypothetical protein
MAVDKKLLSIREIDISPTLISALKKVRQSYDEGGPVKPPIDLSEYLELGIRLATMSEEERKSLQFMFDKLTESKK